MISLRTGKPVNDVNMGIFHPIKNEYRWLIVNAFPEFREGETTPYRVCSTFSDVTGRRRAQDAIQQSEERFSKAFHSSPDMLTIINLDTGEYVEVNESFINTTGYSREELIGLTRDDINIWASPEEEEKMGRLMAKDNMIRGEEFHIRAKSGEIRTWQCSADVITIGGDRCLLGVAADITDRRRAEAALKESEEKFIKAFRASPAIMAISRSKDGVFLDINNALCNTTGYTNEEVIGHSAMELGIWGDPKERIRYLRMLQEHGSISNAEIKFRMKSGELRDFLLSAELISLSGETCILVVLIDITERKRAQEQERETQNLRELNRLRTELLANVSHELRTPLASIKGFTTVMMDYDNKLNSDEKRDYLEIIDNNTDRLSELIEQLLVMSRLGAGTLTIEKSPNHIEQLCQDVIAEAKVWASDYQFTIDIPSTLPRAHIDARRIRQVINNLIENAVKNSERGSKINISARENADMILMTITDEGLGISKKDQPRIFDRMFHADRNHKSGASGAGLGLSICKGLVEAHDGRIWIESEEGKGTRCFFTLPIYRSRGNSHGKKDKGQYHSLHRR